MPSHHYRERLSYGAWPMYSRTLCTSFRPSCTISRQFPTLVCSSTPSHHYAHLLLFIDQEQFPRTVFPHSTSTDPTTSTLRHPQTPFKYKTTPPNQSKPPSPSLSARPFLCHRYLLPPCHRVHPPTTRCNNAPDHIQHRQHSTFIVCCHKIHPCTAFDIAIIIVPRVVLKISMPSLVPGVPLHLYERKVISLNTAAAPRSRIQ